MKKDSTRVIPKLNGHWLLGSLEDFKRAPHDFMASASTSESGLVKFRILNKPMIGILDVKCAETVFKTNSEKYPRGKQRKHLAALMGFGLLNLEDERWKQHRRLVAQAFRPEFLQRTLEKNVRLMAAFLDRWESKGENEGVIDAVNEMRHVTLAAIIDATFSTEIDPIKDNAVSEAIINANHLLYTRYYSLLKAPEWIPTPLNRQFSLARQAMNRFITKQIGIKKAEKDRKPQDIVDHFLQLEAEGQMSLDEIYDEIRTLLIAGFETSATSLSWALYLIAENPSVQTKWHQELDAVLGSQPPSWESIKKLKYTEHLFMEAMRLYPPGYMLSRTCQQDDTVDGYKITAGTSVLLSIYSIHRSPRYWKNPDKFYPERFDKDWPEHAYFPFGIGKHICIGNRFALLESIVVLACIGQRFNLFRTETEEVRPDPRVTLIPSREISINLERRK